MLTAYLVLAAGLVWLGLLFAVALWGERRLDLFRNRWHWIYALSLAVYCTSWTFYGTVTQALRSGWPIPPTFIGTILLYTLGIGLLYRLTELARRHHSSSLADLIATRLGKDTHLAAVITGVAVLGMLPYIALQLKAVAMSYGLLTRAEGQLPVPWQDTSLYVAAGMAVFAMLFGARKAVATEHNRGLVLAMAFESLLKLVAMLLIGAFVLFGLPSLPPAGALQATDSSGFLPLIALGVLAVFTLPHLFHVGVVECRDPAHLRTARWLFPLYMLLIALPLLPLARAGQALLGEHQVPSDLYVLALPLSQGQETLALLAFLGGLSAATGMVILATLALSIMIGNHWLAPVLVRSVWSDQGGGDLRGMVLAQRRFVIAGLLLLAWLYSRALAGNDALADIGAVSFSALATLAPPLAYALWRPRTPAFAVNAGLVAAGLLWIWILLVPMLLEAGGWQPAWVREGLIGFGWLAPERMLGLAEWSRVGRAVAVSLAAGLVLPLLLSGRAAGARFTPGAPLDRRRLQQVAVRFIPAAELHAIFIDPDAASLEERVEAALAKVLGTSSARLLLKTARREGHHLDEVVSLVGETSAALRFNQQLLEAALENMSQGISVVDAELKLMAWNRRYAELFGFPDELLQIGRPVIDLQRWAIEHGFIERKGDLESMLQRRLEHMRAGTPHLSERRFPDGTMVEIRGNPMPGGGYVATFTDVTAFRRTEQQLKRFTATLERRVADRTAELQAAKVEAERANNAKSRFLAAISHDLFQPLNAAQLFTHTLAQQTRDTGKQETARHIENALDSIENLLDSCLDLSRLESGRLQPDIECFPLAELLDGLVAEYRGLASEKGLKLRYMPTRLWVRSDRRLLRRIIQNFLANAVRYTHRGGILLGCRRRGARAAIQVIDTGPGIDARDQERIFDEFLRLEQGKQTADGLGLGLSIVKGIADLMGDPLEVRSVSGSGTLFGIAVRVTGAREKLAEPAPGVTRRHLPLRVLCIEDDSEMLRSLTGLLQGWGCTVAAASGWHDGIGQIDTLRPQVLLADYHLDRQHNGLEVIEMIRARLDQDVPAAIITADRSDTIRTAAADAGIHYLNKPVRPMALRGLLDSVLRNSI